MLWSALGIHLMKTSQWPHQPSVCASFLLMEGFFSPSPSLPPHFPRKPPKFQLIWENLWFSSIRPLWCGKPKIWSPVKPSRIWSPVFSVQMIYCICLQASCCICTCPSMPSQTSLRPNLEWKSCVLRKKKLGGIGNPDSEWNSRSAAGKGSCSSTGRAWCWQLQGHGFVS